MKIIQNLMLWFKRNTLRAVIILGFIIAIIFALIIGDNHKIQAVLKPVLWFTPLLLLREIEYLAKWLSRYWKKQ